MHRYCTKYGTWLHRPNQQGVLEIWQRKDDCNPFTSGDYSAELDETVDADVSGDKTANFQYMQL